jgi:hypothetical protein
VADDVDDDSQNGRHHYSPRIDCLSQKVWAARARTVIVAEAIQPWFW